MASQLPSIRKVAKSHSHGIHWTTCATMLTAWASGVLLAVGHHLFYHSLDGTSVSNGYFFSGLSKQQLTFALGTMFAFLVNSLLALALSTSYLQVVWKAIKQRETPLPVIDTLFSGTTTIYSLWRLDIWWKHPLLFLLAFAFWCIPISSVITPATLSVVFAAQTPPPTVLLAVPNVDFLSLNFADISVIDSLSSPWMYRGPQWAVNKVVAGAAADGSILPLDHPHANASWMLEFSGPSLTCTDIQGQQLNAIIENINHTVQTDTCELSYGYISWTPEGTDYLPFTRQSDNESATLRSATLGSGAFSLLDIPDAASLYVAAWPGIANSWFTDRCDINSQLMNATVVQCALFNTSYRTSFEFTNGLQAIDVNRDENFHNAVVPIQILNPSAADPPLSDVYPNGTAIENTYNFTEVQTLAYQSVMDALGQLLVGSIRYSEFDGAPVVANTSVMSTVLSDTSELQALTGLATTLQQELTLDPELYHGLSISKTTSSPGAIHLNQALESLFENITISLMSSALLQPNTSSPYAPPLTNVTLPYFHNVYIYSSWKLWIAYGVSISISTLGVIIGLLTMLYNGGSYNRDFSTVFRAARHATINTNIHPADAIGKEPLPNYLAQAVVSFLATESKNHDGASGTEYKYAQIPLTPKSADASSDLLGPRADGFEGRS